MFSFLFLFLQFWIIKRRGRRKEKDVVYRKNEVKNL